MSIKFGVLWNTPVYRIIHTCIKYITNNMNNGSFACQTTGERTVAKNEGSYFIWLVLWLPVYENSFVKVIGPCLHICSNAFPFSSPITDVPEYTFLIPRKRVTDVIWLLTNHEAVSNIISKKAMTLFNPRISLVQPLSVTSIWCID